MAGHRRLGLRMVLGLVLVATAGCNVTVNVGPSVRGSGTLASEDRSATGFDAIVLEGSGEVTVAVTGEDAMVIEAEDNLLPLLTSDVSGSTLTLGTSGSINPTLPIRYTITVSDLRSFSIEGSGAATITDLDGGSFRVVIAGSGSVTASGRTDQVDVEISGSGDYRGGDLIATSATVEISGSGGALVFADDTLDATVSGSGQIRYLGDPTVTRSVSGSGSIAPG